MNENNHKPNQADPTAGWPRKSGMTVPEGYFEQFASKMMERIPADEPRVVEMPPRSLWQKVRPYVYMAAMFAGIWLMMNMFTLFSPVSSSSISGSSSSLLAEVKSSQYMADYMADISDYDLYDDLYDSGFDIPDSL